MAAKPYHAGHDGLVRLAAKECDVVKVFVSLSDRKRPREVPIYGVDMHTIWINYIQPTLPSNVEVTYDTVAPIKKVYDEIDTDRLEEPEAELVIYSDVEDAQKNFGDDKLAKYFPDSYRAGLISTRPVERTSTVNVSGTKMRQHIQDGNLKEFTKFLPKAIRDKAESIWNILSQKKGTK